MQLSDFKEGDVVRLDGVVHYVGDQFVHINIGAGESILVRPENVTLVRRKIDPGMMVEYRLMTCLVLAVVGEEAWLRHPGYDSVIAKLTDLVPAPDPDFDEVEPVPETLPYIPPAPEALAEAAADGVQV